MAEAHEREEKALWLPYGSNDPAYITHFLELARDQGVRLHLDFFLDNCRISHLTCLCAAVKNGRFAVRCPLDAIAEQPVLWGGEVKCYFTITDGKDVPCDFTSRVERLYNGPSESMYLIFPLPTFMGHNQRRSSVRLGLERERPTGFSIWHSLLSEGSSSKLPEVQWVALEEGAYSLADLSAGGMRLDVAAGCRASSQMMSGELVLLKGDFGRQGQQPCLVFLVGTIVRSVVKPDSGGALSVGIRFQRWKKVEDKRGAWFKADADGGMSFVAAWISERLVKKLV